MAAIKFVDNQLDGQIFSWAEISQIHKIRSGIYQRNGRLVSLLTDFGRLNPCYPDFHGKSKDIIFYTGSGRRGDQKLDLANQALLNAIEAEVSVPLFNKLSVSRWKFLGYWRVLEGKYVFDDKQGRMIWRFTLKKIEN